MARLERILLVRHGQTDWNVDGRWQGTLPIELNQAGWSQARALAAYLKGRPIHVIFSSDLPRALQTAWDYIVPGGKSRRLFQSRLYAAWQEVISSSGGSEVVVVTHGGSIKLLLLKLFEGRPDLNELHIENTSVTTVEYGGDQWQLGSLAAIPPL